MDIIKMQSWFSLFFFLIFLFFPRNKKKSSERKPFEWTAKLIKNNNLLD